MKSLAWQFIVEKKQYLFAQLRKGQSIPKQTDTIDYFKS
jgi:hypothetical protein